MVGLAVVVALVVAPQEPVRVGPLRFDDRPAERAAGEWGFRPADGARLATAVRAFTWRPQKDAASYFVQVARDPEFEDVVASRMGVSLPVWCRPALPTGVPLYWRCSYRTMDYEPYSTWSSVRQFTIAADARDGVAGARAFDRKRIREYVPKAHPRLFMRPEDLVLMRDAARSPLAANTAALVARCEGLLATPPSTEEPPKYPPGTKRGSDAWREIWWGNRRRTIAVLENAATLAFTYRITERQEFGELGKELLLATAAWDPKGATGYRYNDEAGMPYAYHFARTYTLVHDLLTEPERQRCRDVMRVRGEEMYRHLCPAHLWQPFNSHRNRAWHFLGEVAIAFHGEIPAADDWLWFAVNVFGSCYPVWSGPEDDGGWHEGMAYWHSYLSRFTWWADVMKTATGIDAYRESRFFERVGDWPLYVTPPGTRGGGFGDLTGRRTSRHQAALMALFAQQAGNGHWQWFAERHGNAALPKRDDWIAFIRGAASPLAAVAPTALPTSRLFAGVGQAALNTTLLAARDNVQVLFKSSPYGTQSHGYEAQNSFLLYAHGERLLIRSGRRDQYGSNHHRNWMWSTRSTNCVTLDGGRIGQGRRTASAVGEIVAFSTSDWCDWVEGEAGAAYGDRVESFRRGILFLKPHAVVIFDRIRTKSEHTFDFWLHAEQPFEIEGDAARARLLVGEARCSIDWLSAAKLRIVQTDRFDPPPRPRVELVEHHLTASTIEPAMAWDCVTVVRPHRAEAEPIPFDVIEPMPGFDRALAFEVDGASVDVQLGRSGDVLVRAGARRFLVEAR